jgi:hypothetical protein
MSVPPWDYLARERGDQRPLHDYSVESASGCLAAMRNVLNGQRIYHMPGSSSYDGSRIDERRGER